jgi:tripartite-type tricarboxylate transporter receptor subunit TctC
MSRSLSITLVLASLLAPLSFANAQESYPARPIKVIVPLAAGGGTDIVARTIAQSIADDWGANIVVENRPGAGTTLAAQALLASPADGYTLMFNTASFLVTPHLMPARPYERTQFAPVSLVAASPHVLVVSEKVPAKTVAELVAWLKSKDGKATYASFGNGSSGHLGTEILLGRLGVSVVHVPYRGNAPALTDVMAGHVDMMLADHVDGNIKASKPRPLAVASAKRSEFLPDVPTVSESGYPGYTSQSWYGLVAPAGTPDSVLEKWHAGVVAALKKPDVRKKLIDQGIDPIGSTSAEFRSFMDTEDGKYSAAIKAANIKMQ